MQTSSNNCYHGNTSVFGLNILWASAVQTCTQIFTNDIWDMFTPRGSGADFGAISGQNYMVTLFMFSSLINLCYFIVATQTWLFTEFSEYVYPKMN